jgi:hypothetical protein
MRDKMNINLNNYEAYFLDYHEGNLSLALVKELMEFIEKHPELREEFESFEPIILTDTEEIIYNKKETLKKTTPGINAANFEEYAIESIEGILPVSLQEELNTFISKNPSYKKELELYTKTKLVPDTSIIFEDKPSLKRNRRRTAVYFYWSAAASIAIIVGAYFLLNKNVTPDNTNLVKHNQIKDSNVVAAHIVKQAIDTNAIVAPKNMPHIPINNTVKNSTVAVNATHKFQHNKKVIIPNSVKNDSSAIAVNKDQNKNIQKPVKVQAPLPTHPENDSAALAVNISDTSWTGQPLIRENVITTPTKKKKSRFLALLATLTCKGLHKVTGQHIELEKQYASDTTTIVAYQLDLGNKKYEFPVKD